MFESKYSKILTVFLAIVIIAILTLMGFLGYNYFNKQKTVGDAQNFVDNYTAGGIEDEGTENKDGDVSGEIASTPTSTTETSTRTAKKGNYKGFATVGTMEIPAINFAYPIIDSVGKSEIETAVAVLYPPGGETINQSGNTVVIGHNYRNGLFFSNNKKLNIGDKIYVTDYRGTKITYSIYNKFETSDSDTSFYQRETEGKAELTLSTCTDASNDRRLIILAKQD